MADVKISALPTATTPLAGTEVLPIVQSATTKQVAVSDLTAGRAMSASSLTLTTPLSAANGGTGLSSLGTNVATALGNATNTASGLAVLNASGYLSVAQGGTGLGSLTAGYIPYGNGTGAFSNSANLTYDGTSLTTVTGTSARGGVTMYGYSSTNSYDAPRFQTYRARGTVGSPAVVQAGDELWSWQASGYNGSSGWTYVGGIFMYADSGISGTTVPSYMSFQTNNGAAATERMRIDSSGDLLLGTTSTLNSKLAISNSLGGMAINISNGTNDNTGYGVVQITKPGTNNTMHYFSMIRAGQAVAGIGFTQDSNTFVVVNGGANTDNGMTLTPGGTSWGTQSDFRMKTDLVPIEDAIEKVKRLRTVTGRFKTDPIGKSRSFFIAQDFEGVFEEAMDKSDPDKLIVQYSDTNPLLAAAIKELAAKVSALEAKQ